MNLHLANSNLKDPEFYVPGLPVDWVTARYGIPADEVAKLKLGSDVMVAFITGEPNCQAATLDAAFNFEADPYVVADDPVVVLVLQMRKAFGKLWILHDAIEDTPAAVVVLGMIQIDNALPFHIGLPGEQEYLDRWL